MTHYRFVPDSGDDLAPFRGTFRLEKTNSTPKLRYLKISATRELLFQLGKTFYICSNNIKNYKNFSGMIELGNAMQNPMEMCHWICETESLGK